MNTVNQWLEYLEQLHPVTIDLGLERVAEVAKRLRVNTFAAKVITVAGTNGKGSFVASLDAILRAHDYRVACYTSPHLLHFNERIVINHAMVDDETLMAAFADVEAARQQISLSYFEFTTLAAFVIFAQQPLDFIILEVGLGGRLDAVNIITPDIAVVTSIGLDHQQYLGDTREAIAGEKVGILRQSTPLISAEQDLLQLRPEIAEMRDIALIQRDFVLEEHNSIWQMSYQNWQLSNLPDHGLSINSQAAAVVATKQLLGEKADKSRVQTALTELFLAGRFQHIQRDDGIDIVLDVAHNPQAAELLHHRLQSMPLAAGAKRIAVFHALHDKDVTGIVHCLKDDMTAWFLGELNHPRASSVEQLVNTLRAENCHMISTSKNMRQALSRALSMCKRGDQIIAFGSFLVVAELLPRVLRS